MQKRMTLIADSGSTKTAWLLRCAGHDDLLFESAGINPVRDSEEGIRQEVTFVEGSIVGHMAMNEEWANEGLLGSAVDVFFYGAGCVEPFKRSVEAALASSFSGGRIVVESDLLGAARALCGHDEGIACILGTGSNSCLYDGERIVSNTSPLGWILGDEGSGAVLGRTLVGDLLKGQLGEELKEAFFNRFGLTQADVIERVYRQPQANRWLASLVPFLADNRADEGVHALLVGSFRSFFRRNVSAYGRKDLAVDFVGGVAWQFATELGEAAEVEGFKLGRIEKHPIELMAAFHGA